MIEDQPDVRGLIEKMTRRYGYSAVVAANGPEALTASQAHNGPVHLMLTDVVLPGASGRDITRQVLALRPCIRVLYVSGYTETAIHNRGMLDRDMAFIQKRSRARR